MQALADILNPQIATLQMGLDGIGGNDDDINKDNPGLPGHTAITMDDNGNGSQTSSGGAGYLTQPTAGDSGASTFTLTHQEQTVATTIAIAPDPGI